MERAYLLSSRALGALLFLLGLAMIATTLARGGEATALGVVAGVAFALLGVGRVWLAGGLRARRDRGRRDRA